MTPFQSNGRRVYDQQEMYEIMRGVENHYRARQERRERLERNAELREVARQRAVVCNRRWQYAFFSLALGMLLSSLFVLPWLHGIGASIWVAGVSASILGFYYGVFLVLPEKLSSQLDAIKKKYPLD